MSEQQQYDVFLSHSFQDRAWVSEFVRALREAGVETFFTLEDIFPGENWQEKIEKALRESKTLIVLLSPDNVQSKWMFFELGAAVADRKFIIPILTQDIDIKDLPSLVRNYQFLYEPSPSEAGKRVAEVLTKMGLKQIKEKLPANG